MGIFMELKGRLKLIADKIPECDILTDVGTDHAYIPIHQIKYSKCVKAIASDIKKGPILSAKMNIKEAGYEKYIDTRIGYGLEAINEKEVDVIVIAGMGGILIKDILEKDLYKVRRAKALVLQPMNAIEITREWLYKNGFDILDEELCDEGEKIYNVLVVCWKGETKDTESIYYYIGKRLIEKRDPLLGKLLKKKIQLLKKAITEMEKASDKSNEIKAKYIWMKSEFEILYNLLFSKEKEKTPDINF